MKQNIFGILSLILGIIGLVLSCIAIGIVPAIAGLVLSIIGLTRKDSKHGMAVAGLVCSVIGIAIFMLISFVFTGDSIDEEKSENYLGQLSIEEYSFENTIGDTLQFLVVKNNSDDTLELNVNATAMDEAGNKIGATDSNQNAVGSGDVVVLCNYFDGVKNVAKFEYSMTAKKDNYFESVTKDLEIQESKTENKVILTCTNNGEEPAEFVEAYALFFNNGKLINYDSTYITDDDSEIKAGATISDELNFYGKSYDDVKIYVQGRR